MVHTVTRYQLRPKRKINVKQNASEMGSPRLSRLQCELFGAMRTDGEPNGQSEDSSSWHRGQAWSRLDSVSVCEPNGQSGDPSAQHRG